MVCHMQLYTSDLWLTETYPLYRTVRPQQMEKAIDTAAQLNQRKSPEEATTAVSKALFKRKRPRQQQTRAAETERRLSTRLLQLRVTVQVTPHNWTSTARWRSKRTKTQMFGTWGRVDLGKPASQNVYLAWLWSGKDDILGRANSEDLFHFAINVWTARLPSRYTTISSIQNDRSLAFRTYCFHIWAQYVSKDSLQH